MDVTTLFTCLLPMCFVMGCLALLNGLDYVLSMSLHVNSVRGKGGGGYNILIIM